ncbi:MAG: nucleotidyl transferase AbiEii/AbiGii toxin family protein [Kiritimatiellia bacterium]
MHEKVLPKHSLELLDRFEEIGHASLSGWTLAGGTGLALRLGHRVSEDYDFFRTDNLDLRELHSVFSAIGPYETLQESDHTLSVILKRTAVSFFRVMDAFIFGVEPYRFFSVADIRDIALMKLVAISGRGSRKDFIDLFCILNTGITLQECFTALPRKYSPDRLNTYHILKSLTFFDDAEAEPMPRMLEPFDWDECKAFFVREARAIVMNNGD